VYLTLSMCVPFNLQTMATSCYSKDSCSKKFADNDKQRLLQNTFQHTLLPGRHCRPLTVSGLGSSRTPASLWGFGHPGRPRSLVKVLTKR
jgi:hypothetical protein